MTTVNLELTPEQYRQLLKLTYIGDWVIDEPENKEHNALVQHIFAGAADAGLAGLIDYDKELNIYLPSMDFDEEVLDIVDDFEEECFWDHLIYRLADRDIRDELGEKAEELSMDELIERIDPATEKYLKEFEDNGIGNLYIR